MSFAWLVALAVGQALSDDTARFEALKTEVDDITAELKVITDNQALLSKNSAARRDEIASLRHRYPAIMLTPDSTVAQIYAALVSIRNDRGRAAIDLGKHLQAEHIAKLCKAARELKDAYAEWQTTDEYQRMSLSARLAKRRELETTINESVSKYGCSRP